jgi:hypothetical protein
MYETMTSSAQQTSIRQALKSLMESIDVNESPSAAGEDVVRVRVPSCIPATACTAAHNVILDISIDAGRRTIDIIRADVLRPEGGVLCSAIQCANKTICPTLRSFSSE